MCNITRNMLFISLLIFSVSAAASLSMSGDRKTYIVHMDKSAKPTVFSNHHEWYVSTLSSLSSVDDPASTYLYTYKHVIDGFSAVLSPAHLDRLQNSPGHVASYPESFGHLQTTHTPEFLGLKKQYGLWPAAKFGDDVIVGVVDTGIWPESQSFNDEGMSPIPERWRGTCEVGDEFKASHCNRKLIGARSFSKGLKQYNLNITGLDYDSPRDFDGHGSHTSSTVAGSCVQNVGHFGYAKGSAVGVAPRARIAMYKALFDNGNYTATSVDVLAAMDQAIDDGVDVLSLSLAFIETTFDQNPIAIGAFAALKKGIFVTTAAGNSGPHAYTIDNGAPWITTVGAGTIDRDFVAEVTLGNKNKLTVLGRSIYPENLFVSEVPLYFGYGNKSKEICDHNSLDAAEVAGKYIFCAFSEDVYPYSEMSRTKAAGAIFIESDVGKFLKPKDFNMPFVILDVKHGEVVKEYLTINMNASLSIKFQNTVLGTQPAPQVAYFSSRGPARRSPWILKPDIIAPGVDILAATNPNVPAQPIRENDNLLADYAFKSGTSMACPHVAAIAALLKAAHPNWSPAAIRSAMMTTASVIDNTDGTIMDMRSGIPATPLDFGAGHVIPNRAMDPGLVYDIEVNDYTAYLCGLNYTSQMIRVITGTSDFSCENATLDLNYPSFIVILNNTNTTSFTFKRVLTNVADTNSVYRAMVEVPMGINVIVEPTTISFPGKYSTAEFKMTVSVNLTAGVILPHDYIGNFGFLTWYEVDGKHTVSSPIVSAIASAKPPITSSDVSAFAP